MLAVLVEARGLGFLGPGPVEAHLVHAAGFAEAVGAGQDGGWQPAEAADLGSGGGLPGLPLALFFPSSSWVLIEANQRRARFLRDAVAALRVDPRVRVLEERAEVAGRDPALRARLDVVVARSFGPPAVMAECAAPLLRPGGRAVVSEPPDQASPRWPDTGLGLLGMVTGPEVVAGGASFRVLEQAEPCPDRYPRRTGIPAKRPLF
jgi:16S rRNA (guanine527-N7)-methyltransferase